MEQTQDYSEFLTQVEEAQTTEEKLKNCLSFMREALSREKIPAFKDFWEAKSLCLTLFKEKLTARSRALLWKEYVELSDEIRKVKEILDEESQFAKEQIELAISSIEEELARGASPLDPEILPQPLKEKGSFYLEAQGELNQLNPFAGRINALRKELMQMQMRIKTKNHLFDRLSQMGNQIFPKRKELIEALSAQYAQDVETFVQEKFSLDNPPYFPLKEAIKGLQSFSKQLSLNTKVFKQCREKLSTCWDQIKEKEGRLKLERTEKRKQEKEIQEKRQELREADRQREEKEKEAIKHLISHLGEIIDQAEALSLDALVEKWDALVKEGKTLNPTGVEKALLENRFGAVFDHIQEKKWQSLEGSDDLAAALQDLLEERIGEKKKIKEALEDHRKTVGGSTLSLEESMLYQELIGEEKLRFDTLETMIEEIEEKLFDLEK